MKLLLIAGARPNFMKIAPIVRAVRAHGSGRIDCKIIHTGQHYDNDMSQTFFDELGIPAPDYNLNVGSGSHAVQTANIMIRFEDVCMQEKPDMVAVVGDVNSTVACGLVAKKLNIGLAHVEAGLRSFDRTMPEEINRMVTDAVSDLLFVTEQSGVDNLLREGHPKSHIHFVGHVMIDNLFYQVTQLTSADLTRSREIRDRISGPYAVLTMHRPSNVDDRATLVRLVDVLDELAAKMPIIFPCHPRTRGRIEDAGLVNRFVIRGGVSITRGIVLTKPLGYMDFLNLWKDAVCVVTDSGGLQEETTALKVPCITIRETTERPVTAEIGSNVVVGTDPEKIRRYFTEATEGRWKVSRIPELWDGRAGERIVGVLGG